MQYDRAKLERLLEQTEQAYAALQSVSERRAEVVRQLGLTKARIRHDESKTRHYTTVKTEQGVEKQFLPHPLEEEAAWLEGELSKLDQSYQAAEARWKTLAQLTENLVNAVGYQPRPHQSMAKGLVATV